MLIFEFLLVTLTGLYAQKRFIEPERDYLYLTRMFNKLTVDNLLMGQLGVSHMI